MIQRGLEAAAKCELSAEERLRGLQSIVPKALVKELLLEFHANASACRRVSNHLVVWFIIGIGLCCTDCYEQIFRWLSPFGRFVPGRSTLCEARKRFSPQEFHALAEKIVRLLGVRNTPGCFYKNLRLMALDGYVLDIPDFPQNEQAFGRPQSGRNAGENRLQGE